MGIYFVWVIINSQLLVKQGIQIGHYSDFVTGILFCLLVLSGAYYWGRHRLKNDFSYGYYLYHMIVINALVMLGYRGKVISLILTLMITGVLAVLSFFFIEKPALSKKK